MQSNAQTVAEYIKQLPVDRRKDIEEVRKTIRKYLPQGYEEVMHYGMISYVVPLKTYPSGYLGKKNVPLPYISLASQKNYMSLYLLNVYGNPKAESWFKKEYKASGKKLDMGKSCVRFKSADDLPLNVIGKAVALTPVKDLIEAYESAKSQSRKM